MSLARVTPSPEDIQYLRALGVEWRQIAADYGDTIPCLDDYHVKEAATGHYAWALDKHAQIRKAGGLAALRDDPTIAQYAGSAVVIKPRFNEHGLATGARKMDWLEGEPPPEMSADEVLQPYYDGRHRSVDVAVWNGAPVWTIPARGWPSAHFGRFLAWEVLPVVLEPTQEIRDFCARALPSFTGVINMEYILGHVIEIHLRPSVEFFPLYGDAAPHVLRAAYGQKVAADELDVAGGEMIVLPRGSSATTVTSEELGETDSWRSSLTYLKR